jgi:hypothetical protein
LQAQLSFLSAAVVYKRGLVQTLRNCRTRTRITHTRTTSTVVVSTTPSPPQAKKNSMPARLKLPSKWRTWEWHIPAAAQAQRIKPKTQDSRHLLTMTAATVQASSSAVGMDPRSVGNPYFTHTFEALTAKVSVTSRRQNSLRWAFGMGRLKGKVANFSRSFD